MSHQLTEFKWFFLLCLVFSASSRAADAPALTKSTSIARTDSPPTIDGILDDPAWKNAVVIDDLHQISPREYTEASERTEFLLLYDVDAI